MIGGADTSEIDAFAQALKQVEEIAAPLGERAIGVSLTALKNTLEPVPPQPDRDRANQDHKHPSPYNRYVRGVGVFPRRAFEMVDGQWQRKKKGAYKKGPKGGKVQYTSEQSTKKWLVQVQAKGGAVEGELRNEASYSGVLFGHKPGVNADDGIPAQAIFHAATGWNNIDDSLAAVQPVIDAAFDKAAEQTVKQLVKGSS